MSLLANPAQRLLALRQAMQRNGVDACLIPSSDPHVSEYLPAYWQIRRWLTGFTGSVGTVVVTADRADVWVDSRYWVQAEHELVGSGFSLQRIASVMDAGHIQWLGRQLKDGQVLAVDGRALSLQAREALGKSLSPGVRFELSIDLPGLIWRDRPALPDAPVEIWSQSYAGASTSERLAQLRARMQERSISHHLVSSLDDIAWLLNLRGHDVPFNPVFLGHLLIEAGGSATLFAEKSKFSPDIALDLANDAIELREYDQAAEALKSLSRGDRLWVDPAKTTCALVDGTGASLYFDVNPSTLAKAQKSAVELAHWREVMAVDGAALCEFFAWLDQAIECRDEVLLTELTIDQKINEARAAQVGFKGPSFATIAAFNANGAMPHYRATAKSHARIEGHGILLIDSGGQYLGGTTDITRMVPVGRVSVEQARDCALVLKAMIAMSKAVFPQGIMAPLIDAIARQVLWLHRLDYGHGTGHGVGYGLNVHEGPQVLSYKAMPNPNMAMQVGMVTSNEPGLYRPGQWGVRIENLVCAEPAGDQGFGMFLKFETLTLCPIDLRCVDLSLLNADEKSWLNSYHDDVRRRLSPKLSGAGLVWLLERTEPVPL